eukprot:6912153-Prymnesium_polylepis.1
MAAAPRSRSPSDPAPMCTAGRDWSASPLNAMASRWIRKGGSLYWQALSHACRRQHRAVLLEV